MVLLNNTGTEAKYNVTVPLDGSLGPIGGEKGQSCFAETKLRFEVIGVGSNNRIEVQGKLRNSANWYDIATIPGAVTGTLDISTYDFIRYISLVVDGTGVLIGSGYIFSSDGATAANQAIGNATLASIDVKQVGNLLAGVSFDDFQAAFPDSVTEVYSYYLAGILQATVEVTYTSSTKVTTQRARRI